MTSQCKACSSHPLFSRTGEFMQTTRWGSFFRREALSAPDSLRARAMRGAVCAALVTVLLGLAEAAPAMPEAEASVAPASLALAVDASAGRKSISPYIY